MKVLKDNNGKIIIFNNKAFTVLGTSPDIELPKYNGHVDTEGLTALGWDSDDIAWLQAHVWWNAEDDEYWAVTEANLAFGPNGATPLTWANRTSVQTNPDVRYFPKFNLNPSSNTSWASLLSFYIYVCAIPTHGWNTSNVTSLNSTFSYNYSLRSVGDLSSWNVAKVTSLAYTFYLCYPLIDVGNLDSWNTANITSMVYMFYACYALTNVGDLSQWNTEKVTSIQGAFHTCRSLRSIGELSNWNISAMTNICGAFQNCISLTSIGDLSNWDTSKVTRMDNLMYACARINHIGDLSKWDTSSVTNMGSMFYNCFSLTSVGDLSKWDTSKVTNMASMFSYCYLLSQTLDLSSWDTSIVTNMSYMFGGGNTYLTKLNVNDWDLSSVTNISRMFWACYCLTELDLTDWDTSTVTDVGTSAGLSMFSECRSLHTLKLGPKFFNFTPAKIYINQCNCWTRDSIYESLYTNQTLRDSNSSAKTVALSTNTYDSLSVQDIEDIATKNITLTRG